jgi:hypothetical protein
MEELATLLASLENESLLLDRFPEAFLKGLSHRIIEVLQVSLVQLQSHL